MSTAIIRLGDVLIAVNLKPYDPDQNICADNGEQLVRTMDIVIRSRGTWRYKLNLFFSSRVRTEI